MNTICFVAGHSGGHIIPCVTHAQRIRAEQPHATILFFTTTNEFDKKIIQNYQCITTLVQLPLCKLPGKQFFTYPLFVVQVIASCVKSLMMLYKSKPQRIISMGGLVSIPVCIAATLLRIPIELWELNVEPGKTIRCLASFATTINICFKETKKYFPNHTCSVVKYPVRFSEQDKKKSRENICTTLGLAHAKKTILIVGGSQGSQFLNNLIKQWLIENNSIHAHIQIIHQTGNQDLAIMQEFYKRLQIPAIVFAFYSNIQDYYCIADLIICRAGAGTLAEIIFFEKKCITIPLQTSTTAHQLQNALALQKQYPDLVTVMYQQHVKSINEFMNKNI